MTAVDCPLKPIPENTYTIFNLDVKILQLHIIAERLLRKYGLTKTIHSKSIHLSWKLMPSYLLGVITLTSLVDMIWEKWALKSRFPKPGNTPKMKINIYQLNTKP